MSTVRKQPLRQCIGCNEMKEKKQLIRIIKTAEDEIILDSTGKKNGRGAYICPCGQCLDKVIKTNGLNRAFKMNIEKNVIDRLMEELKQYETR